MKRIFRHCALRTFSVFTLGVCIAGCGNNNTAGTGTNEPGAAPPASSPPAGKGEAATPPPAELAKPAAGKGNVQGRVLYDDKPAVNIEVKLSEKFSPFLGGGSGKSYTARTDSNGDYVIKDVPPKEYEGLTAKVFDTDMVIFIRSGFVEAKTYKVEAGKTLFVEPTHLFKSDLRVTSPKASSTVKQAAFAWAPYPSAAYYKISIYPDDMKSQAGVYAERVDGTTYTPVKPLPNGSYRLQVEAWNSNDRKLSTNSEGYKFRVG